jgi:hypothetical protein
MNKLTTQKAQKTTRATKTTRKTTYKITKQSKARDL